MNHLSPSSELLFNYEAKPSDILKDQLQEILDQAHAAETLLVERTLAQGADVAFTTHGTRVMRLCALRTLAKRLMSDIEPQSAVGADFDGVQELLTLHRDEAIKRLVRGEEHSISTSAASNFCALTEARARGIWCEFLADFGTHLRTWNERRQELLLVEQHPILDRLLEIRGLTYEDFDSAQRTELAKDFCKATKLKFRPTQPCSLEIYALAKELYRWTLDRVKEGYNYVSIKDAYESYAANGERGATEAEG